MTCILMTLVLASVALMAAASGKHDVGAPAAGGLGVTLFVCAHCTATGQLSSRGLFLNWASVWRHIAASKHCRAADLGYWQIQVEALAGDVMAGAGGAAGPAPDVRHQPPGDANLKEERRETNGYSPDQKKSNTNVPTLAVQW